MNAALLNDYRSILTEDDERLAKLHCRRVWWFEQVGAEVLCSSVTNKYDPADRPMGTGKSVDLKLVVWPV